MDFYSLPVYKHKDKIIELLKENQVLIIESPTGSGKTTQLPLILHENGYDNDLMIGVTQPRRIASMNVTSFIKKQLNLDEKDSTVALKMRFQDDTDPYTKIKVMTDGILLEEIKTDPQLSRYSVIMVDEAHERSLNIDFTLGLLKEILKYRHDLRVIISSATINPKEFSVFFDDAKVLSISGKAYDVDIEYVPLMIKTRDRRMALDYKVDTIVSLVHKEMKKKSGDILIFLPGEALIKSVYTSLKNTNFSNKLDIYPLYSRLSKEEQNSVFTPTPKGLVKVVVATNIAETSITIDGITVVIDTGDAKNNYYNQSNYTSSLIENQISQSNANQRAGRAGRTRPGVCYRLYDEANFKARPEFPSPEILRSDLSDVVLRSVELGIENAEDFPFITQVSKEAIASAYNTLISLGALDNERHMTELGHFMMRFPLSVRHARILAESVYKYPGALKKVLIAVSFISSKTPFVSLDEENEDDAKRVWRRYKNPWGDFVAFLSIFEEYTSLYASEEKKHYCDTHYLDYECMKEVESVEAQLEEIISSLGIPITDDCSIMEYLLCIAEGLKQFISKSIGREEFISVTGERVALSPSTLLSSKDIDYIVSAELAQTHRLYARTVSPLRAEWLSLIPGDIHKCFYNEIKKKGEKKAAKSSEKGESRNKKSQKKKKKSKGKKKR